MKKIQGVQIRVMFHPTFLGGETHIHMIVPLPINFDDSKERHDIQAYWLRFQILPPKFAEINGLIDNIREIVGKINSILIGKNNTDGTYLDLLIIRREKDASGTISKLEQLVSASAQRRDVKQLC